MKIKWPKNLGHIVTNFSFIAFALALVVIIGGRIFAQNTTTATDGESDDYMQNAVLNWQTGSSSNTSGGIATLNKDYVNSTDRVTEFFEGSECEIANIDCFTKNYQSSQILGYTALTTGRSSTGTTTTTADGAIQGVSKVIAWTFQPQASGAYYVADALQNMGVVSPTYAQGFGYYSLSPYLKLWRVFRNIAYIFFTVVIIVIGFMILLRQKAGGQAAVTAQQALPRIIVALILVTFSYAIAGFCIDLMYWLMYAFSSFLNFSTGSVTTANQLVNGNFGNVIQIVGLGNAIGLFESVNSVTTSLLESVFGGKSTIVSTLLSGLAGLIGTFIIVIALLTALFRLLFILLKSYAIVLLNIIFAPLSLMMVAISGGKAFKNWFMSIVANLSPFVITFFMLVIVGTLNAFFRNVTGTASLNGPVYSEANGQANAQGFSPPYMFSSSGENAVSNLGTIIGLAIALAIPELVENIKKKLGGDTGIFGQVMSDAAKNFEKARKGRIAKTVGGAATGLALTGAGAALSPIRGRIAARQQTVGTAKLDLKNKKSNALATIDSEISGQDSLLAANNIQLNAARAEGRTEDAIKIEEKIQEIKEEREGLVKKREQIQSTTWRKIQGDRRKNKDQSVQLWDGESLESYNSFKDKKRTAAKDYARDRYNGSTFMTRVVKRTKQGSWGATKGVISEPFEERAKKREEYLNLMTLATSIEEKGTTYGYTTSDTGSAKKWRESNQTFANWRQNKFPPLNLQR